MDNKFGLGDRVMMKKPHPCGSGTWQVIRIGADIKIKCEGCGRIVMLDRATFEKRLKKVLERKTGELPLDGQRTEQEKHSET